MAFRALRLRSLQGGCHCGNIRYILRWPNAEIRGRECSCTYCRMHGNVWTSLEAVAGAKYKFGTGTADFHVCSRCGVVPFVTSDIDDRLYAVVNVNTLQGETVSRQPATFDAEDVEARLRRRKDNWIPDVTISSHD